MKTNDHMAGSKLPRRRFFTKLMQGVITLGLAGTAGYLLMKEKNGESCSLDFTCTLCDKTALCGLPAAESYRKYDRLRKQRERIQAQEQQMLKEKRESNKSN
jgi:hypothetical protein